MNHHNFLLSLTLLCGLLFAGCATQSKTGLPPTTQVDIFRDGTKPEKSCKEIGRLDDDGKESEQPEIEAKMIKRAKSMGGNAIVFEKPKPSGMEAGPWSFGSLKYTYLYRATVFVYE
jgi:hypothetical protein